MTIDFAGDTVYPENVLTTSCSAGAYVCNDLFYTLRHRCEGTEVQVGFIHMPYLPGQGDGKAPVMENETMVRALRIAAETLNG